ncbi:molybdate ABC transporter substrate-binding protein [Anaerocolumna cellulosilytica]|uniref:Molybdate ABC transporter substrate-binding protein n=1 Tax=Anaerocolumna cellulosilytica TaxID=433286 RepID=A0A6S6R828_9FIRM|nr:molybdate ABC transporter substrate-binding protein [Anaerocolumna cellulosilytica]MBB5197962.1 molybdate transport system substrate-binding protein [Anaerocolumna cellulosilytica]BCJ95158.1 molybdate ABC transporter substrate-binding protein [Anaerocolumna cellulosilytica]
MKKMKMLLVLLLFATIFAFVGCDKKNPSKEANGITEVTETLTEQPSQTVTPEQSVKEDKSAEILVAAAASLQNAMEELEQLYKVTNPNVTLTFTFGSSGTLQQQIEQGAPVDVFMSAALKQMTALEEGGFILDDTKKELLENKVVLIVPKESDLGLSSFEDIVKAPIIALGDPASVPVGQYSEEIFTTLGILDKVKEKVTYGKDVTEVLTWVATGNAYAGVVYATDAKSSDNVMVVAEAPVGSTSKVIYPIAVVKDSKAQEAAKAFVQYLSSKDAIEVFEKYGFEENK